MAVPPCHFHPSRTRSSSRFVLCVIVCSIFFVTSATRLQSDVFDTDGVDRPTELSNAQHTSSYQAQKESKRLQFTLSRRSVGVDKGGNQSQSSSKFAVNGKFKLAAYFQDALERSERRRERLSGNHHRRAHRNKVYNPEYTSPSYAFEGDHVVDFVLGTPPQNVRLIMDTGSDLVWLTGGRPNQFNAALSLTYRVPSCADVTCSSQGSMYCQLGSVCIYEYNYEDGSRTSGTLSYDTVTLPEEGGGQSNHLPNFIFGLSFDVSEEFADVDGVMGLGMQDISFASQVASEEGNIFSYCLMNWGGSPTATSPLIVGSDAISSAVQFTPLISNEFGLYYVGLDSISVGGQQLSIPQGTFDIQDDGTGGLIFDSGTTFTVLYAAAYNPLVQTIQATVSYPTTSETGNYLCYDISEVSNPTFPEVSFAFAGGAIMNLRQENVFGFPFNSSEISDVACLLVMLGTNEEGPAIFGNAQQQNRHIVYDLQAQRIGWSHPVECSSA